MVMLIVSLVVFASLSIAYIIFKKQKIKSEKNSEKVALEFKKYLEQNVKIIQDLTLVGAGEDGNSDYTFLEAVKQINIPQNIGVEIDG